MSQAETLHVLLLELEFLVPDAQSLKDKRRVLKMCTERLRNQFNASVIEFGFRDKWQRAGIAISMLSNDRTYLLGASTRIENQLADVPDIQMLQIRQQWL